MTYYDPSNHITALKIKQLKLKAYNLKLNFIYKKIATVKTKKNLQRNKQVNKIKLNKQNKINKNM